MLKSIVARPLARVLALGAVQLVLSLVVMSTIVLAQSGTITYIIKSGESLRQIAEAHDTTIEEILALNPSISDANQIYVGATILLPGEEEAEEEADPGTAAAVCPNLYTTKAGDTFASIARAHNVEAATLALVNNKSVVSWLAAGTELCIPGGTGGRRASVREQRPRPQRPGSPPYRGSPPQRSRMFRRPDKAPAAGTRSNGVTSWPASP